MFLSILMFISWQAKGDRYKEPFTKSTEAYYQTSDVKHLVDGASNRIRKDCPAIAITAPVLYGAGVKHEIRFTSRKITPIPGTVSSYHFSSANKSGSIQVTWSF